MGKKQEIGIRELFREKLGNEEIVPDASFRSDLMRKVRMKEFLSFNPARINIYYIGGFLAAGVITALILSSGSSKTEVKQNDGQYIDIQQYVDTNEVPVSTAQTGISQKDNKNVIRFETVNEKQVSVKHLKPSNPDKEKNLILNKNEVIHSEIKEKISENRFFNSNEAEKKKLREIHHQAGDLIVSSLSEGCTPLKVKFSIRSSVYDSCRWSFGDGGYSDKTDPEWIYDSEGEYNVVLTVFGTDGSKKITSSFIKVHPKPSARFEISRTETNNPDNEILFLNYSSNAVRFKWDFGDGNSSDFFEPKYKYEKSGNYNVMLVASSENGCSDSLVVLNAITGSMYYISFPNAFIPNIGGPTGGYYSPKSDEAAQVFHPVFSGVSDYQLRVFSKHGIAIFESNDINVGWDGYFKGQLCEQGVYIWKVRGSFLNGEPYIKMGDVTLLKN